MCAGELGLEDGRLYVGVDENSEFLQVKEEHGAQDYGSGDGGDDDDYVYVFEDFL